MPIAFALGGTNDQCSLPAELRVKWISDVAPDRGKRMAGRHLPPFTTALGLALLGVLVFLSALCAACRRKARKKVVPPDGVKLVDVSLLRQMQLRSLSKSDTKLHELNRVKRTDEHQRPASVDFLYPSGSSGDGEGAMHSSSFSILLRRELPQIPPSDPSADALCPDQTYSNLFFSALLNPAPEALYACAAGTPEGPPPKPVLGTPLSEADKAVTAEYACVRKVKKNFPDETQGESSVGPADPEGWEGAACNPPAVKVEDMYSTVCKAGKKKKHQGSAPSLSEGMDTGETGQGEHGRPAAHPRGVRAGYQSTPGRVSLTEPCYESINDGSWTEHGRTPAPEPAYEAVDVNWKKPKKRDKSSKNCPTENLYESISEMWEGDSRNTTTVTAPNGLEVYITDL
ncbi:Lck interacting transmembrane adaptor 1 [Chelydra serpentina]|uniref:Lck interacting transmembrane adaptor 1 n=1 Tax=Chelydra serpentina TaxID=8475 RepID=A0A8T1TAG3_CHESE|nr:Lck interacting transmembrane adaptor 1 [Chelydra serpentina]